MSEQNAENSKPQQIDNLDIDKLLTQVGQMANKVERLINANSTSPKTSNSPDSAAQPACPSPAAQAPSTAMDSLNELDEAKDIQELDEWAQRNAKVIETEIKTLSREDISLPDASCETECDEALPSETAKDIAVDEGTNQLAEDEINEALSHLQPPPAQTTPTEESKEQATLATETVPAIFKIIMLSLLIIDRPFLWLPRNVKDILGYVGISTLFFALGLWIVMSIFY